MGTWVMPVSELQSKTREVLDELRGQGKEVYVTRYGHPVAVLVDYEHYERLKALSQRTETTAASAQPRPGAQYPTVANPPSSLKNWLNLIPEGYEGDALADTEALYDEI